MPGDEQRRIPGCGLDRHQQQQEAQQRERRPGQHDSGLAGAALVVGARLVAGVADSRVQRLAAFHAGDGSEQGAPIGDRAQRDRDHCRDRVERAQDQQVAPGVAARFAEGGEEHLGYRIAATVGLAHRDHQPDAEHRGQQGRHQRSDEGQDRGQQEQEDIEDQQGEQGQRPGSEQAEATDHPAPAVRGADPANLHRFRREGRGDALPATCARAGCARNGSDPSASPSRPAAAGGSRRAGTARSAGPRPAASWARPRIPLR